jgi:hypothetical protein
MQNLRRQVLQDGREFRRTSCALGRLVRELVVLVLIYGWTLLRLLWSRLQANAENGARGWR